MPPDAPLVTCGGDTIRVWDWQTKSARVSCTPAPGCNVNCLKWNHTNSFVVSAGEDGKICLWQFENGDTFYVPEETNAEEALKAMWLLKGSRYLITGGSGHIVKIWDLKNKRCTKVLKGHTDEVTGLAFQSQDQQLASVSVSGNLVLHSLMSASKVGELRDPQGQVLRSVEYSPHSRHLIVTGGDSGAVHLWDSTSTSRNTKMSWMEKHSAPISGVCFSPADPKTVVSAGLDKRFVFLDPGIRGHTSVLTTDEPITSLAFRGDGLILAAGTQYGGIKLVDIRKGALDDAASFRAHDGPGGRGPAVASIHWQHLNPSPVSEPRSRAPITFENALLGIRPEYVSIVPDPVVAASGPRSSVSQERPAELRNGTSSLSRLDSLGRASVDSATSVNARPGGGLNWAPSYAGSGAGSLALEPKPNLLPSSERGSARGSDAANHLRTTGNDVRRSLNIPKRGGDAFKSQGMEVFSPVMESRPNGGPFPRLLAAAAEGGKMQLSTDSTAIQGLSLLPPGASSGSLSRSREDIRGMTFSLNPDEALGPHYTQPPDLTWRKDRVNASSAPTLAERTPPPGVLSGRSGSWGKEEFVADPNLSPGQSGGAPQPTSKVKVSESFLTSPESKADRPVSAIGPPGASEYTSSYTNAAYSSRAHAAANGGSGGEGKSGVRSDEKQKQSEDDEEQRKWEEAERRASWGTATSVGRPSEDDGGGGRMRRASDDLGAGGVYEDLATWGVGGGGGFSKDKVLRHSAWAANGEPWDGTEDGEGGGEKRNDFVLKLVKDQLDQSLDVMKKAMEERFQNLHLEVLRQAHTQQIMFKSYMDEMEAKQELLLNEIRLLKKKNELIKHMY